MAFVQTRDFPVMTLPYSSADLVHALEFSSLSRRIRREEVGMKKRQIVEPATLVRHGDCSRHLGANYCYK